MFSLLFIFLGFLGIWVSWPMWAIVVLFALVGVFIIYYFRG